MKPKIDIAHSLIKFEEIADCLTLELAELHSFLLKNGFDFYANAVFEHYSFGYDLMLAANDWYSLDGKWTSDKEEQALCISHVNSAAQKLSRISWLFSVMSKSDILPASEWKGSIRQKILSLLTDTKALINAMEDEVEKTKALRFA